MTGGQGQGSGFCGKLCVLEAFPMSNRASASPKWSCLTLEKFMEDCLPWEGLHTGVRV